MSILLDYIPAISAESKRTVTVDATLFLDGAATLTGTPTVTEVTTTDLTISSIQLNSTDIVVNGRDVEPNKAVMFQVEGQEAGSEYQIVIRFETTDSQEEEFRIAFRAI